MIRRLGLLCGCVVLVMAAPIVARAGDRLSIPDARERAAEFAAQTCSHDESCANAGVQNCRRLRDRVVLCRIFDHRKTEIQGNFVCTRLVRLALQKQTRRTVVTGLGDWDC